MKLDNKQNSLSRKKNTIQNQKKSFTKTNSCTIVNFD